MDEQQKTRGQIVLTRENHQLVKLIAETRGLTLRGWVAEKVAEEILDGTIPRDLAPHLAAQIGFIERQRAKNAA